MIKCIHCGGEVLVQPGGSVGICTRCMAENPIPKDDVSADTYAQATEALRESRFDEAIGLYQKLLIKNPQDAAVNWGMALAEYGIEYVEDPATGEQLPTLHRLSMQKFSGYLYVQKAIDQAWNSLDRDFYIKQSELIDSIQGKSLSISKQEVPVDIFLCYKRSEEGNKRTADSRMAADYYRELTRRGYKVFFAEETLKVGEEYEPRIFAALRSAKVLIAVASRKEYYEAVWVRNEWSRYADLIAQDQKESGGTERLLIPIYQHLRHEELPEILRDQPSYVEMDASPNAKAELLSLVAEHFEKGKEEDVSSILREVRGSAGAAAAGGALKAPGKRSKAAEAEPQESAEKTRILATVRLAGGEYEEAERLFRKAIGQKGGAQDPDNYLGLFMCEHEIPGREALGSYAGKIALDPNFQKAFQCASNEKKKELHEIAENCAANIEWERSNQDKQEECSRRARELLQSFQEDKAKEGAEYRVAWARLQDYKRRANLKGTVNTELLILLIAGVVLPLAAMAIARVMDKDASSLAGVFLIIQSIIWCVIGWRFMNRELILDGGCFMYLLRLTIIGGLVTLFWGLTMSKFVVPAAIVAVVGVGIYCWTVFSSIGARKRKNAEDRRWAAEFRRGLPELEERTVEALEAELVRETADYRRYSRNYDSDLATWKRELQTAVREKTDELRAQLNECERGSE